MKWFRAKRLEVVVKYVNLSTLSYNGKYKTYQFSSDCTATKLVHCQRWTQWNETNSEGVLTFYCNCIIRKFFIPAIASKKEVWRFSSSNSLRPISYFGSIWELCFRPKKQKNLQKKESATFCHRQGTHSAKIVLKVVQTILIND